MRNLQRLDRWRDIGPAVRERFGGTGDATCGVFHCPQMPPSDGSGHLLKVIAASGDGWDHVSVSLPHRCPTWLEMDGIKRAFFLPEETAFQLHVPVAQHIDNHPFTLHLWRPLWLEIPRPPSWMVG